MRYGVWFFFLHLYLNQCIKNSVGHQLTTMVSFLPPVSAVQVIELEPSVCVCLSVSTLNESHG